VIHIIRGVASRGVAAAGGGIIDTKGSRIRKIRPSTAGRDRDFMRLMTKMSWSPGRRKRKSSIFPSSFGVSCFTADRSAAELNHGFMSAFPGMFGKPLT
jgi:hypothetical protein